VFIFNNFDSFLIFVYKIKMSISINNNFPYTRLMAKIQRLGNITMESDVTLYEINNLINSMKKIIPGIDKHDNNRINFQVDAILLDSHFYINGSNGDLYAFLSRNDIMQCLDNIKYNRLSEKQFDERFYPEDKQYKYCTESCSICLEQFNTESSIINTDCNHLFHSHCLKKWLTTACYSQSCPICRNNL